LISTVLFLAVG